MTHQGNPSAVWVFQIASTLITASNSSVVIINGGQECNVFWQVGSSATLGTGTTFIGNILALTSIALNTNANLSGRALARNGAVTMDTNTVAITACAVPPVAPTIGKAFSPATIDAGGSLDPYHYLEQCPARPPPERVAHRHIAQRRDGRSGCASTTCGGTVSHHGASTVTLTGGSIPASSSCTVTVDVTAPTAGSYINSLASRRLATNNGTMPLRSLRP